LKVFQWDRPFYEWFWVYLVVPRRLSPHIRPVCPSPPPPVVFAVVRSLVCPIPDTPGSPRRFSEFLLSWPLPRVSLYCFLGSSFLRPSFPSFRINHFRRSAQFTSGSPKGQPPHFWFATSYLPGIPCPLSRVFEDSLFPSRLFFLPPFTFYQPFFPHIGACHSFFENPPPIRSAVHPSSFLWSSFETTPIQNPKA